MTNRISPDLAQRIAAAVDGDALVAACCAAIDIPSPTGGELEMARFMRRSMEAQGLHITWQEIEDSRANVIGAWEGAGNGPRLMFNGHLDTSNTGDEDFLTGRGYKPRAVVENGFIHGLGIYNMKGALMCYLAAVGALQRAGVRLTGDILVGAVAGEIEKTQVGEEFQGKEYRGYGVGTHYLISHGILPDMCLLGEPTDMQVVLGHFGSMWARISTRGIYVHSAFAPGREDQHSVHRMKQILDEVVRFFPCWEEKAAYKGQKGHINIGCLRGGEPWRVSRTPARTDLYLDVRVPPTMPMEEARRTIKNLVLELRSRYPDYGLEFETFVSVPGAEIREDHDLVRAVERNHQTITGEPARRDTVLWCSDASVLSRFGVPTLNYGPSSGPRDAEGEKVSIRTLVEITKVYALTAAEICGVAQ